MADSTSNVLQLQWLRDGLCVAELNPTSLDPMMVEQFGCSMVQLADDPRLRILVVDMSHVEFLPSRFLAVLLDLHHRLQQKKGQLRICGLQPRMSEVFSIMRLQQVLSIDPTLQDALAKSG
jgi:anti-sigma B factor antagonist